MQHYRSLLFFSEFSIISPLLTKNRFQPTADEIPETYRLLLTTLSKKQSSDEFSYHTDASTGTIKLASRTSPLALNTLGEFPDILQTSFRVILEEKEIPLYVC